MNGMGFFSVRRKQRGAVGCHITSGWIALAFLFPLFFTLLNHFELLPPSKVSLSLWWPRMTSRPPAALPSMSRKPDWRPTCHLSSRHLGSIHSSTSNHLLLLLTTNTNIKHKFQDGPRQEDHCCPQEGCFSPSFLGYDPGEFLHLIYLSFEHGRRGMGAGLNTTRFWFLIGLETFQGWSRDGCYPFQRLGRIWNA